MYQITDCVTISLSSRRVKKFPVKMAKRTIDQLIPNEDVDDIPALKKRREERNNLPKIFDGTYYEVVEHDINTKTIAAKCKKCIKDKIIRGQSSSTGNFYQHFLRTHFDDHKDMKEYCDERTGKTAKRTISSKMQTMLSFNGSLDSLKVMNIKKIQ